MSVIQQHLATLIDRQDLTASAMESAMDSIMQGEATPAQIAGFIVALRMKGETVTELAAAARVMRKLSSKVDLGQHDLVDTCGTGGDGQKTFNISTASAIVAASAGVKIAKHGNRSVSSQTGSADVLETLGVRLTITSEVIADCVRQVGIGFMFAPMHHSCMKHAIGPRKELAVRTLFNLLGPLTNPAAAKRQVLGVFDDVWLEPLAKVLDTLGSEHCLVVHADDGLDEISISAPTQVCELNRGEITRYQIKPEDFGLQRADASAIRVEDASQSAQMIRAIFAGELGPAADIVSLNAGAAIYIGKQAPSLSAGVEIAASQLQSGAAAKTLAALIEFTTTAA